MSTQPQPETEPRDALRMKIEASERRIAERTLADSAKDAASSAAEYTRQNPLTVIGGAIAAGLLIGLMTKPGRRAASYAASGAASAASTAASSAADAASDAASSTVQAAKNVSAKSTDKFGALIADAIVAYGMSFIDDVLGGARAGQDALEDIGDSATAKARSLRREASYLAGSAADTGRNVSRRTRRRAERAVRDLTDKVRG